MSKIVTAQSWSGARTVNVPKRACTLDALFRQEHPRLVRYLTKKVGPEVANDIAQDIFVRAASSQQLSSLVNPQAFLHRIARNLLIDRARRQRCQIVMVTTTDPVEGRSPADQEYKLDADDLEASLAIALNGLPERTRKIFIMHRFDNMAYREIQRELELSLPGVEYHMMKALCHVRTYLRERATIPATSANPECAADNQK